MNGKSTYKYLTLFLVLNICFQLVSDVTAGKIIQVAGIGVSITVLYFPITFVIADILTEVYGYAEARRVIWYTMLASITAGLFYQLVVYVPAAPGFENGPAYKAVLGIVPRVLIGSWLAIFSGDMSNNYVLARMKVMTGGRFLWMRTIGSTIVGQGVNTAVFYVIALGGVIESNELAMAIIAGWVFKTLVEAVLTPLTYLVVAFLKRSEGVDVYDDRTDFNPFKMATENQETNAADADYS